LTDLEGRVKNYKTPLHHHQSFIRPAHSRILVLYVTHDIAFSQQCLFYTVFSNYGRHQ